MCFKHFRPSRRNLYHKTNNYRHMKKLENILNDFELGAIKLNLQNNPKILEEFGYIISDNTILTHTELMPDSFNCKYTGDLSGVFYLKINRVFHADITFKENNGLIRSFSGKMMLKGRYHLKNKGDGEIEVLSSSPYSRIGNITRKFCKPEEIIAPPDTEFYDFSFEDFLIQ